MRPARKIGWLTLARGLSACATLSHSAPESPSPEEWGALLNTTDVLVNAGRHAAADSTLRAFAAAHPGTRAAEETLFWRALYKMDPRSSAATRAEGRALMDEYAASSKTSWYRGQANVLRHLAREISEAEQSAPDATADSTLVPGDTTAGGIAAR